MTTPEEQPTVGDFLARLEFKYDNDVLDFLKTGKGVVVVEDKVANIPLPKGAKGDKGDIGQLREGDVRYFNRRTDEAEAAAEASEASAVRSKTSETKAKTSETNAKTSETKAKTSETNSKTSENNAKASETNAKTSETKAKTSETNAKTSETKAKASEEESAVQAELSGDAAVLAITAAATVTQYVGDGFPEGKVSAPVGSIYVDRQATAGVVRWIKTSGTGATGWQVEYGDTGLRNITNLISGITAGKVLYQRKNGRIALTFEAVQGSGATTFSIPGSRAKAELRFHLFRGSSIATPTLQFVARPLYGHGVFFIDGQTVDGEVSWDSNDAWSSTLPGTPS